MEIGVFTSNIMCFFVSSCGVECHRACCHYNEIKVFEERDHMLCVQEKWMCRHCFFWGLFVHTSNMHL